MKYVFDSGPLIWLFRHYYKNRFPSLWKNFDSLVGNGRLLSVREVMNELLGQEDDLSRWVKENKSFFETPEPEELMFVMDIFKAKHFQTMIRKKERLQGKPVADPFIIAKAKIENATVVTTENLKIN